MRDEQSLPLAGVKVIEFTHMVMGPAVGLLLADMGADVIKLELAHGDKTRGLPGSGAGYFPAYNRNKRSLCVDLKSSEVGIVNSKALSASRPTRHNKLVPRNSVLDMVPTG